MLSCVLLFVSVVKPPATVLYFSTGTYWWYDLCCTMIALQYRHLLVVQPLLYYDFVFHNAPMHQYVNSHLHCSQTNAVPLFAKFFGFVNSQSSVLCGIETPTTFPSKPYHSHLQEVLNAAVE
jgi:hypothetical protein